MDVEDVCVDDDNLDNTNIELHPSLTFNADEVLYLGVNIPGTEDDNVDPDPGVNPW